MLKAVISHNEQTAIVELPMDRLSLQYGTVADWYPQAGQGHSDPR